MGSSSSIQIYRPDGDIENSTLTLAPQIQNLDGCRIAVLDNGKPNAALVMTQAARHLAERTGAILELVIKKGPGGRSANAAIPCAPDVFAQLVAEADIVITGAADCGSCSAYSVADAVSLERAGVPTVIVTTTLFERVVDTVARSDGMTSIRKLVLEHPLGGTDRTVLEKRAGDAADRLIELFTGSAMISNASPPIVGDMGLVDIESLRALVAADGADLEVASVEDLPESLRLRLVLPDISCWDCVMPSQVLARIAFERFAGSLPGLRSVVVLDPRDEPTEGRENS
jgi:hypothetical protein